jgi:hypothetical protein
MTGVYYKKKEKEERRDEIFVPFNRIKRGIGGLGTQMLRPNPIPRTVTRRTLDTRTVV